MLFSLLPLCVVVVVVVVVVDVVVVVIVVAAAGGCSAGSDSRFCRWRWSSRDKEGLFNRRAVRCGGSNCHHCYSHDAAGNLLLLLPTRVAEKCKKSSVGCPPPSPPLDDKH